MTRPFFALFRWLYQFLYKPKTVTLCCLGLLFLHLILDGSLYQLWKLYRDQERVEIKIAHLQAAETSLDSKIKKVTDPRYLELEARDRLDLVHEGDLVFVFSQEASQEGG